MRDTPTYSSQYLLDFVSTDFHFFQPIEHFLCGSMTEVRLDATIFFVWPILRHVTFNYTEHVSHTAPTGMLLNKVHSTLIEIKE